MLDHHAGAISLEHTLAPAWERSDFHCKHQPQLERFCRRHLPSPPAEPETLKQHLIMLCLGPKSSKSSPFHQEQSPMVYTVLHNLAHLTSASPSTPCSYVPATMTNLFHDLPQGLCTGCFPCLECYSSSLITSISFLSTIR